MLLLLLPALHLLRTRGDRVFPGAPPCSLCLLRCWGTPSSCLALQARHGLSCRLAWRVYVAGLGLPPRVGLGRQVLHLLLPPDVRMLLLDRGRLLARVPQPLVPLWGHLDVAEVRVARVLDDAPPPDSRVVRVATEIAKLPVGVALEIEADKEPLPPW